MKKAYLILLLILILQIVNFLFALPAYIPSWHHALELITQVNYILIPILFIVSVVIIIRNIVKDKLKFSQWGKPAALSVLSVILIFIGGLFTFIAVTDDFFSSRQLVKQYTYKNADATVYIYDESFLDPRFSVKVKNSRWPVVSDVFTSADGGFPEDVSFNENEDRLYITTSSDTLVIDSKQIMNY